MYRPLTTNIDSEGRTFVSSMEAYDYPFYGTQFHPEVTIFNFYPNYGINHTMFAI